MAKADGPADGEQLMRWQKERMMMLAPPKVQTMVRLLMVPHTGKAGQLITSSMGQPMEQSMAQRKGQQRAQQKGKKTDTESWREGGVWSSRVEARIQRRRAPRPTMMTSAEDLCLAFKLG
jgi:hypothetical protein